MPDATNSLISDGGFPNQTILETPLKWAGSKRWAIPLLRELYSPFQDRVFRDPCCGGLSVPIALQPRVAVLSDINPHLIGFWQWVQRGGKLAIEFENTEESYYELRTRFNQSKGHPEMKDWEAEAFYLLLKHGHRGLCRFNGDKEFNVPFGYYQSVFLIKDFALYSDMMQGWSFRCAHYLNDQWGPGDFIYWDPPYDNPEGGKSFRGYFGGFTYAEQVEAAERLSVHPGPVVAHNHASERMLDLYRHLGFTVETVEVKRSIGSRRGVTQGSKALEMIATKNCK